MCGFELHPKLSLASRCAFVYFMLLSLVAHVPRFSIPIQLWASLLGFLADEETAADEQGEQVDDAKRKRNQGVCSLFSQTHLWRGGGEQGLIDDAELQESESE